MSFLTKTWNNLINRKLAIQYIVITAVTSLFYTLVWSPEHEHTSESHDQVCIPVFWSINQASEPLTWHDISSDGFRKEFTAAAVIKTHRDSIKTSLSTFPQTTQPETRRPWWAVIIHCWMHLMTEHRKHRIQRQRRMRLTPFPPPPAFPLPDRQIRVQKL